MITGRLRHLQAHGMINREVVATSPAPFKYKIIDFGNTAIRPLDELRQLSEKILSDLTGDGKANG